MLTINNNISIPIREFEFQFSRSPGPGGQNVNKVNTKVTLKWNVDNSPSVSDSVKSRLQKTQTKRINKEGFLVVTSHRFRDQGRNVADCLEKLREIVVAATIVPKPRKKTKPSRSSIRRRLDSKRRRSEKKKSRRDPSAE